MLEFFSDPTTWTALLKILWINILLSGDNAVVIALAVRSLPPRQQKLGIMFGSGGAVVLRIVLTFFVVYLLNVPFLKIIGAVLLVWIGVKLLVPEHEGGGKVSDNDNLWAAFRTIVIADVVMSLDNVLGVAAAANGNMTLIIIGLVISIPLVVFGSQIILKLMDRFPIIITIGGGLLGYVAGEMAVTDNTVAGWIDANAHYLHYVLPVAGAVLVIALGTWLSKRKGVSAERVEELDLGAGGREADVSEGARSK